MAQKVYRYDVTISPANATDNEVVYSVVAGTGAGTIETIYDEDGDKWYGLLTPTALGTVTVVATATDGSDVTGEIEVEVQEYSDEPVLISSITLGGPAVVYLGEEEDDE